VNARTAARLLALAGLGWELTAFGAVVCTVSSVGVNFGVYDPLSSSSDDSTGQVSLSCTLTPPPSSETIAYSIQLGAGNGGTFSPRGLRSGLDTMQYNLFRDAGRTQIWGSGLSGTFTVADSVTLGPGVGNRTRSRSYTIYGRIPAGQDVATGNYADTIVITVDF
jgi:spore coat protein U-like protein